MALPRAGREPGEVTRISYRYRQGFPDDIHVWTLTRRVEACSGVRMRQEGLASEQEGFAVTGSLWEGAALTGAVIPLPGHREHLNWKEPDMVISALLTHTFSQCKMQSYSLSTSISHQRQSASPHSSPATTSPQSCLDSPSSQLWSALNPIQPTDKCPSDFTLPAW